MTRGARPGRHEAHDIGNLTYISEELNGLMGVGADPLKLRREPGGNRAAHVLGDGDVLRAFERACADGRLKSYRSFCKRRRKRIEAALVTWDTEAWKAGEVSRSRCRPEAPARRLLAETLEDRLRELKYPAELTTKVVGLLALGFREGRLAENEDGQIRLVLRRKGTRKGDGTGKRPRVRPNLVAGGAELAVKVSDSGLKRRFEQDLPGIPVRIRKGALVCPLATGDGAGRDKALRVLEWLAGRLS